MRMSALLLLLFSSVLSNTQATVKTAPTNELVKVTPKGKIGYANQNNEVVIPCEYDYAFKLTEHNCIALSHKLEDEIMDTITDYRGNNLTTNKVKGFSSDDSFKDRGNGLSDSRWSIIRDDSSQTGQSVLTTSTNNPELVDCKFRLIEKDGLYPVIPMVEINNVSKKDFKSLIMYYKIVCDDRVSSNSSKYVVNEDFKLCPSTKTGYDGKHRFAISGINDVDKIKNGVLKMEGPVDKYADVRWDVVNSNNLGILVTECDYYYNDGSHISLLPQGKKMLLPLSKEFESDEEDISGLSHYEGDFSMPGFSYWGNEERGGKADYFYTNASDGTRIYEGIFKFFGKSGTEFFGKYKNNKQIGKWFWKQSGERFAIDGCITFNDRGTVNGDFDMNVEDEIVRTNYKYCYQLHSSFKNGKLVYVDEFNLTSGSRMRAIGKFSSYSGNPIGEWTLIGAEVPNGEAKIVFDDNGNCIQAHYFEKSTGDKYTLARWLIEYPKSRYKDIVNTARNRCFRDTNKPTY